MNTNYHIGKSELLCPICNYENDVCEEIRTLFEHEIVECKNCECKFDAMADVCYTTQYKCKLNDKEHEWEDRPTMGHYLNIVNCKNCDAWKYEGTDKIQND